MSSVAAIHDVELEHTFIRSQVLAARGMPSVASPDIEPVEADHDQGAEVIDAGVSQIRPLPSPVVVTTAAGTRTEALGRRSSYTYQLEAFAAHLREGAPVPTGADEAVANMQLIDDCYRAAGLSRRGEKEMVET